MRPNLGKERDLLVGPGSIKHESLAARCWHYNTLRPKERERKRKREKHSAAVGKGYSLYPLCFCSLSQKPEKVIVEPPVHVCVCAFTTK